MQYISLKTFQNLFPECSFPLTSGQADAFRALLYERLPGAVHEQEERIRILSDEASLLFMGWIDNEDSLLAVLTTGEVERPFANKTRLKEHAFFGKFREFVTPFLLPVLTREAATTAHAKQAAVLSFAELLSDQASGQVQEIVYRNLKTEQEEMERSIARAASEEALTKAVQPYLKPAFIALLNSFGMSFYRARTGWMEALFSVSSHPASTKRLVLHIARQLAALHLSEEHSREIRQLNNDVRTGALNVERSRTPWKRIAFLSIGITVLAGICWYVWSIPAAPEKITEQQNNTSFMSFSVAERKAMDSLLRQVTYTQQLPEDAIDQGVLPYVGIDLELKEPWQNATAEKLFASWQLHDTLSNYPDPANSKKDNRAFPGTKNLVEKPGTITAALSNPTPLSVFIMVFQDRQGAPVFTGYISSKTVKKFKLQPGDVLFALPGSKVPRELKAGDLPFDEVDGRFFAHMRNKYSVSAASPPAIKLVWQEISGSDYILLDLNRALTK